MLRTLKLVLLNALILIGFFYALQISEWLMNQQSSIANVGGLLLSLTIIIMFFYWLKDLFIKFIKTN
jgi:hypothetical protein